MTRTHAGAWLAVLLTTGTLTGCSTIVDFLPSPRAVPPNAVSASAASPSAAPTPEPVTGRKTEVGNLRIGDCLTEPEDGMGTIDATVRVVPCVAAHDYEVYEEFDIPGGPYPGDNAVTAAAEAGCASHFEGFVRVAYANSALDFNYFTPAERDWTGQGEHRVTCLLLDPAGPVTGTLEGSAQ
jgi:hypothetical protein